MVPSLFSACSILMTISLTSISNPVWSVLIAMSVAVFVSAIVSLIVRRWPYASLSLDALSRICQLVTALIFFRLVDKTEIALQLVFTFSLIMAQELPVSVQMIRSVFGLVSIIGEFELETTYIVIAVASADALIEIGVVLYFWIKSTKFNANSPGLTPENKSMNTELQVQSKSVLSRVSKTSKSSQEQKYKINSPEQRGIPALLSRGSIHPETEDSR